MGSANGRHRRPRQAPALIVAAGVTGSAIAIPLLGAAGAHAAEASTWDRVAECESGGMWSADLGNGFYGGLQFSSETWSAYGGTAYASRADLASRSQQISVAEKVLGDQGPKAWASCAAISGLVVDGTLPGVDPGGVPSTGPSDTTSTGDASSSPSPDAPGDAKNGDTGDGTDGTAGTDGRDGRGETGAAAGSGAEKSTGTSDASASPSATPSPGTSTTPDASNDRGETDETDETGGKHRGTPAPEATNPAEDAEDGRESGRHASRGGDARTGGAQGAQDADGGYTVRQGDSLSAIADAQELPGGWTALYEANKGEVGADPDLILPGQDLDLDLQKDAENDAENDAEDDVGN